MAKAVTSPRPVGAGVKRIRQQGKNAYRSPGPVEDGHCSYCGRWGPLTWDHALPRGTFPQYRNERRNLVLACWQCNRAREDTTWKPKWSKLPKVAREWALSVELPGRIARYFDGVPDV